MSPSLYLSLAHFLSLIMKRAAVSFKWGKKLHLRKLKLPVLIMQINELEVDVRFPPCDVERINMENG